MRFSMEQEEHILRQSHYISSSDFRTTIGVAASTLNEIYKKNGVKLASGSKRNTKYLNPTDARKVLETRGYRFPKKAKIISLMICKGGTGKSTSSFYLSQRLASYGARVLVIDADPQGNLTLAFDLEEYGIELNAETPVLYDVYNKDLDIEDVIITVTPNLHLIPSTPENSVLDDTIKRKHVNPSLPLKEALKPLMKDYDYVIVDCAPALNLTNTTVIAASDIVLLPVNPDAFSEMSLNQTLSEIERIEEGFKLNIDRRIVFSRFDQREYTSLRYLSSIFEEKKDHMFKTIIRTSADLKNAISKSEDLFSYSKSTAKEDYDNLACEVMGLKGLPKKRKGARAKK